MAAPVSLPAVRPHRARTGAIVGSMAAAVLSAALLSVSGDGGESTPAWWNAVALIAPAALLLTGLLLMVPKPWRRFGVGFVAGVLAAFAVVIGFLTWFLLYTVE